MTEVLAGRVEFYFCPINTALPYIRDGRLLALVVNSEKRAAELPDVPTTLEAGYRDADLAIWIGMLAPAKSPRDVINKLHAEAAKVLVLPATREKLAKTGVEQMLLSPAEFDARVRQEIVTNGAVARAAGIQPRLRGTRAALMLRSAHALGVRASRSMRRAPGRHLRDASSAAGCDAPVCRA